MQTRYHRAAVILALAAMMLRAFLPMGWMPNPAGFAQSPLVICLMDTPSGLDVSEAPSQAMSHTMDMSKMDMSKMDMAKGGGQDHGQSQNSEPCPFAAAPHIAAPGGLIAELAPPTELARLAEKPATETRLAPRASYQPQSPRAPPSFA